MTRRLQTIVNAIKSTCDTTAAGAYRLIEYIGTSGAPLSTSDIAKFPAPPASVRVDFVIAFVGDATSKTTPSGNFVCTGGSFCSGDNLDQDLISALKKVGGGSGVRLLFLIRPLLEFCFAARTCLQFALSSQACCTCDKLFPHSRQTQRIVSHGTASLFVRARRNSQGTAPCEQSHLYWQPSLPLLLVICLKVNSLQVCISASRDSAH